MYKKMAVKGTRCHFCTGCGRCPGVGEGINIIADNMLPVGWSRVRGSASEELLVTVDIGTTTVAMQLYGEDGTVQDFFLTVNPQTKYGADVLSRILAAKEPAVADKMKKMIREVIMQGLNRFREKLPAGKGLRMVLAANTTMVYLLLGYDTDKLGRAPFVAEHLEEHRIDFEGVPCFIFPGLSAFVGGDIVAGMYACELAEKKEMTLLIDLGTNGEMVLGNKERIIACSTAAGPAFEGGANKGVWGADMISFLARLLQEGIVDETGLLIDEYFDSGILIGDVRVTQQAIRAIQLAKAAIAAGIHILVREYGITLQSIDRVILAGGFGYYLKPQAAAAIGLLPKELVSKTAAGGNTALTGAERYGMCGVGEPFPKELFCRTKVLNIAEVEDFQELYLQHMNLSGM